MEKESIISILREKRRFPPSKKFSKQAHIKSLRQYQKLYQESIKNPSRFWAKIANELAWFQKWKKVYSWNKKKLQCKWFDKGKINVSYNCLDRHLPAKKDKIAIIWQGEPEEDVKRYTYNELHQEVCKFANVLKKHGIKKGDRVCMYMPMIPELPIAMLACARLGIIHSVVFGGFSSHALAERINDSEAKMLITADGSYRRGSIVPLKQNADEALQHCPSIKKVVVVKRVDGKVPMKKGRDVWWHEEMEGGLLRDSKKAVPMEAEEPLFILYTSGTTGKPKGILHTTAGYLVYCYISTRLIFDLKEEDIYWCTADIGWVTGHSYTVYGPLANGASVVIYEGAPDYPNPDRFWQIVEKFKITIFYTAPTAIRALAAHGDKWPRKHNLSSLRLLGTVGEPINPEAWVWYYRVIGNSRCPIMDTWWQTETGGILISPLPCMSLKPGSASKPFFGIVPKILREDGREAGIDEGGYLVIEKPWPAMARTIWKDKQRFRETYFTKFPGLYLTGDSAREDKDNDFWIMGRLDDVIKIAGHRIGTAEVESALVSHSSVAEAAIVPIPHQIKGQAIYAFVTLKKGVPKTEKLREELRAHVAREIGPIAKPEKIQFADALPKTRSGKIMRRILKAIASGEEQVGDISTLAEQDVVEQLVKGRQ